VIRALISKRKAGLTAIKDVVGTRRHHTRLLRMVIEHQHGVTQYVESKSTEGSHETVLAVMLGTSEEGRLDKVEVRRHVEAFFRKRMDDEWVR